MKKILTFLMFIFVLFFVAACDNGSKEEKQYTYNSFTSSDKAIFMNAIGEEIPFLPNNEYYVEAKDSSVRFYTIGNTDEDFTNYQKIIIKFGYKYVSWSLEEGHGYEKENIKLLLTDYIKEEKKYIEVNVCLNDSSNNSGEETPENPGGGNTETPGGNETTSMIASLLNEAQSLAPGASLSGDRTITAKVGEIDEPYTDQYKNISFYLTDGEYSILVHRGKGDGIENLKTGDTVTVTGTVTNYQFINSTDTIIEFAKPTITVVSSGNSGSGEQGNTGSGYLFNDFTNEEKDLFDEYFGFVIPFIPNNEYGVEEFDPSTDGVSGVYFWACGNTINEFNAYKAGLSNKGFSYDGTDIDEEYGDTWYWYSKGDIYLDLVYYVEDGKSCIEVHVYMESSGGNEGGSSSEDAEIITNDGKGLPSSSNGVYDIDFTKAENVKNVSQQGNYLDGCPTSGNVKVLVIPVEFSDVTAASKGYDLNKLKLAFNGSGNDTDYRSVKEYYFESSYEQLDLDFVVLDSWFRPNNTSSYYANLTMEYYDSEAFIGDQVIMDEALAYLSSTMDLTIFDSDNNSVIDAVVMINTLEIDKNINFNWAYRYWNIYTNDEGYYYEYDGVSANDYLWASYKFLYEGTYGEYTDTSAMNTYTYIHEFGHVLGVDDYYDYSEKANDPLDGRDIMDISIGDHNPFSKINLGWLTTSRLVVASNSVTLTLKEFTSTGDTIIIANNWDPTLGAYQEYYILMYYRHIGLNENGLYFEDEGVVMYHVNSSLYKGEYEGEIYYDIYNSNTDETEEYGTYDNLIELCKSSSNDYVCVVGSSSSSSLVDDLGNTISYTFTVDSLNSEFATITFTKNK